MEEWISGRQIKAARALLGWKRKDLAGRCGVSDETVEVVEADEANQAALAATRTGMRRALEAQGVTFTNGGAIGVALVPAAIGLRADQLNASNDD